MASWGLSALLYIFPIKIKEFSYCISTLTSCLLCLLYAYFFKSIGPGSITMWHSILQINESCILTSLETGLEIYISLQLVISHYSDSFQIPLFRRNNNFALIRSHIPFDHSRSCDFVFTYCPILLCFKKKNFPWSDLQMTPSAPYCNKVI